MTATVITYRDGQIVQEPADAHFARITAEKEFARTLPLHVSNMLGLSARHMRQEYLGNLERREGAETAERVRAAFLAAWESRKGAA